MIQSSKELWGILAVFGSAFSFYMATVVIRWADGVVDITAGYFVFARFLLGFFVIGTIMLLKRQPFRPKRYDLLLGRAMTNAFAVFCFFKAVELTSVAEANILNVTYPIFIVFFSWFLLKQQRDLISFGMAFVAFLGILLVLNPGELRLHPDNLWGLASGMTGAIAIIILNVVRQYNDTETILLFIFGSGTVMIYLMFWDQIFIPAPQELYYLALCAIFGILGQYLLTLGFRYVTAVEGGIFSSSRILMASVLGPVVTSEAALPFFGWVGALTIFGTNVFLAWRKARITEKPVSQPIPNNRVQ